MKFVTFQYEEKEKIGIFKDDETKVYEISSILKEKEEINSMVEFIANVTEEEIKTLKDAISSESQNFTVYPLENIKITSPIKRPIHDIICVGVNYKDHLKETEDSFKEEFSAPSKTIYFSKRATDIIGPKDVIESRMDLDTELDYEVELAIIIGKKGKDISKEKAQDYIFGYSIFNDISSRKLQREHLQWYKGKSLDTYSSMGPVILHKRALPFPVEVNVKTFVNDELRQSSNTKLFISDIPHIISEISAGMTIEPGDIIITGTPSGVGMAMRPQKYLQVGDTVTCEIEKIGKLINIVK